MKGGAASPPWGLDPQARIDALERTVRELRAENDALRAARDAALRVATWGPPWRADGPRGAVLTPPAS